MLPVREAGPLVVAEHAERPRDAEDNRPVSVRGFEPRFMKIGVLTAALEELTPRAVRDADPDRAIEDWIEYAHELGADDYITKPFSLRELTSRVRAVLRRAAAADRPAAGTYRDAHLVADFDAVAYIREHHADITNLHLKDRKKHEGDNLPWGQGETPIRAVLLMLKQEKWPIPAYVEYEYRGTGTPTEEVKKCFQYAKQILS